MTINLRKVEHLSRRDQILFRFAATNLNNVEILLRGENIFMPAMRIDAQEIDAPS